MRPNISPCEECVAHYKTQSRRSSSKKDSKQAEPLIRCTHYGTGAVNTNLLIFRYNGKCVFVKFTEHIEESLDIALKEFQELGGTRDRIEFHVPSSALSKKGLVKISECVWPTMSLRPRTIVDLVVRPPDGETSGPPPHYLDVHRTVSNSSTSKRSNETESNTERKRFLGIPLK